MITFSSFFVSAKRDNGDTFYTLSPNRPEWLQDAVYEAHHGTLPNDWIYEECYRACQSIDDQELADEDSVFSYVDSRVDVYTKALYQWAADFCLTDTFAEAEAEAQDMGFPEETEKRIAAIQYAAIRHIVETMRDACAQVGQEETAE